MNDDNYPTLFPEEGQEPQWDFMSVSGSYQKKGLNDSGVETFKDDSFKSLAREICQNSLDAKKTVVSDGEALPVVVEFHRYSQSSDKFPGKEKMIDAFKRSQSFWEKEEVDETVRFFKEAEKTLTAENLEWMRISDFKTFGLRGVERPANASGTTPWSSLVMSDGVSNKSGEAGGSFGIGKFATFSCSAIRTCFYSTITDSDFQGAQGVSRLVTFENDDDTRTLGIGYFRNCGEAIGNTLNLDPSFSRGEHGTDIFIPGFLPDKSWMEDVQKAVLEGFLYAIFHKKLIVRLQDGDSEPVTMDRKWLDDCFNANTLPDETVRQNYKALTLDREENLFCKVFGEDGSVELRLLIEPNLNRRIAMIRGTGMKIFDKGNFPSSISFSGVLVVTGAGLNKRIKAFENPQHTKWEPKRNKQDEKLYKDIIQFCRDSLTKLVEENNPEEAGANLGDVLPATGETEDRETLETLTPKISMLKKSKRIKKRPVVKIQVSHEDEGEDQTETDEPGSDQGSGGGIGTTENDADSGRSHGGSDQGNGNGPSEEGTQNKTRFKSIEAGSSRSICANERSGSYRMILVPKRKEENAAVAINAVAELSTYAADIVSAELSDGTPLSVEGNKITGLRFQKDEPVRINLKMNYTEYVSLEVEWYGIV